MGRAELRIDELHKALLDDDKAMTWLRGRGLSDAVIADAQLGYERGGRYADCIVIPYTDAQGRCRGVRYRHLRPNPPMKYESPKGFPKHLYNVAAVSEPVVVICEGEFDSLVCRELGYASVAITGTGGWERDWRWLFRDCDLVMVVMDRAVVDDNPDAAEAENRTRNQILAQVGLVTSVEPIDLPEGFDVTDLYLSDPDKLKELLA